MKRRATVVALVLLVIQVVAVGTAFSACETPCGDGDAHACSICTDCFCCAVPSFSLSESLVASRPPTVCVGEPAPLPSHLLPVSPGRDILHIPKAAA